MADYRDRRPKVLIPQRRGGRRRPHRGSALVRTLALLLALAIGVGAGYVDVRTASMQPAAMILGVGALVLGFARPATGWLYALLAALFVPLVHIAAPLVGLFEAHPRQPNLGATLFAVGPALVGSLAGLLLHRVIFGTSRVAA